MIPIITAAAPTNPIRRGRSRVVEDAMAAVTGASVPRMGAACGIQENTEVIEIARRIRRKVGVHPFQAFSL
jgi:hypothetical protein